MNAVLDTTTGEMLEYCHLIKNPNQVIFKKASANDLGKLAQGVGTRMYRGINTIFFINPSEMSKGKKSAYYKLVVSIRPLKEEKNRISVTIDRDRLEYEGNKLIVPATLTTIKIYLNSVVSTNEAGYIIADIKDFYYRTPIENCEYGYLPLELIPEEIIQQYNLTQLVINDKVYFEICKGMPGLK